MNRFIIFILFLCPLLSYGQEEERKDKNQAKMADFLNKLNNDDKKGSIIATTPHAEKDGEGALIDTISKQIIVKSFPDVSNYYSECYAKVVNQYGSWKGIGPKLSKDDIRHIWRYVKLSRPAGQPSTAPFTHMQVLNSFGKMGNNSYGPILANPFGSDEGISSSWKWKLMDICQFEKIYRNGVVIQENMYDEDGKLVLQYFPTSVSKNQIVGHYTDAYGTLAKLRTDEECTYVGITLDENGYESQISFMDNKGQLKRNGDDAFIQLLKHDAQGNLTQTMSADAVGTPIIDNWGNCGWQYAYDENGNDTTATCINQFGQPQRMQKKRGKDIEDCVRIRMTYDKWGNVLTRTFYDKDWNPDTIMGGIHRYVFTKTLYGNTTSMRAEYFNGHLVPTQSTWRQKLDNQGHCLYYVEQSADGHLWTSGTCIIRANYENGERVWEERYTSPNGVDSVLSYRFVRTPSCDSTFYFDDEYINIERYDEHRRLISDEYYNLDMNPIQRYNYHKHTTAYTERAGCSIKEDRYLDEKEQPGKIEKDYWRKYNVEIETHDHNDRTYSDLEYDDKHLISSIEVDSVKRQRVITKYEDGHITEKYAFYLSEDCNTVESLLYFDSLGCRGRTFKADALYYNARKYINVQGNNIAWRGINEFGEPSYILNGDWDYATLFCTNVLGDDYYYDEKGDTIPRYSKGRKEFKDSLYKSFCIELIDSVALQLGLRTGDIVIRYGNWQYPVPSIYGRYYELLLCLESVRRAFDTKTMVVMRHDEKTRTSRLIELSMPVGTSKQLGFIYHMLYMTEKEKKRYENVIRDFLPYVDLDSLNTGEKNNDNVKFITPYKVGNNYDKRVFIEGFKENAIIIGWEPHANNQSYLFTCNSSIYDKTFVNEYDSITLHYTVDGKNIKQYIFKKEDVDYVRLSNTNIGDATDIYSLADSLQREFNMMHSYEKIVLSPHEAATRLLQLHGTTESSNSGKKYEGDGDFKYGGISKLYKVQVYYDSLSYNDMFLAQNILSNIDYGDYYYIRNDRDWAYFHENKGKFDETTWKGNDYILYLSGNVDFNDKNAVIIEAVDSSLFREQEFNGKYLLLQCNTWRFGMKGGNSLREELASQDSHNIVMAEILDDESGYTLGRTIMQQFPTGNLGLKWRWEKISDKAFFDALKRSKRLRVRKMKGKKLSNLIDELQITAE